MRSISKVSSSNFYGLGVCQSHGYSMINMASIKKRNWWGWEWSWEVLHVHVVILGQSKTDILIFRILWLDSLISIHHLSLQDSFSFTMPQSGCWRKVSSFWWIAWQIIMMCINWVWPVSQNSWECTQGFSLF